MLDKVKNTIKEHKLIDKGNKVLLGVSGGPDSVALTVILNNLKKELKISLHIAHLDHMLRKDSCEDRKLVEGLGMRFGIPVTFSRIDIKSLARKGSLEEIARNARLEFLFKVAKKIKADKIALGHTRDDQAETVLMRILRGAGLCGLSGIMPKRNISGYVIVRPIIELRRRDIESFLKRKKIGFRIDTSNLEDIYFRNKIRNRLLPLLEKEYNKNIRELLATMAQSVGDDYDYLCSVARRAAGDAKAKFELKKLLKLHPAIRRLVIRRAIAFTKGDTRRITFRHIKEIEDLIFNRPQNSIVDLPRGISVVKNKYLRLYRR